MQGPIQSYGIDRPNLLLRSEDTPNPGRRWVFRIELDTVLTDDIEADELRKLLEDSKTHNQAAGWLIDKRNSGDAEADFIRAAFRLKGNESVDTTTAARNEPRVVVQEDFSPAGGNKTVSVDAVMETKKAADIRKDLKSRKYTDAMGKIKESNTGNDDHNKRARAMVDAAFPKPTP